MREALAATNHDYIARDERATNSRRRDKSGKSKGPAGWRRSLRGKRGLGAMLFMGFAAVVAIGVPLNALYLQDARHPAPMFQTSLLAQPPAGQAAYAPMPSADPAKQRATPQSAARTETALAEATKVEVSKSSQKARDPISALLQGGSTQKAEANDKNKTVLAAQRALAKLGYSLHQDGVFGGTTRQAIEKFERANGMPVKGELSSKIRHLLSSRAGIAVK